ncbi:MAG TPA: SapC family protein [Rhizomicrobium sp.]
MRKDKIVTAPAEAPASPLFYRKPEALNPAAHADLRLRQAVDFGFARKTNSVQITASEFAAVARNFPIVFAGEEHYPAAVLGLDAENLFVDEGGKWAEHAYVPAYVRRYPFAFISFDDGKQFALGVDRASERLITEKDDKSVPLFADSKPTRLTDEALRFCIAFQNDHAVTKTFIQALSEQNLLVEVQYAAPMAMGKYISLKGFQVVDASRFQNLPDTVVLDWHRKGWLSLVQFHLASQDLWRDLTARQAVAMASAA